jgi:single-strand DNA-binding protein
VSKGGRVVGRLQEQIWTAQAWSVRSVVEVVAEELGPSLRWATATPVKATSSASNSTGKCACQRRLTSTWQVSDRVTGGPS